MSPVQATAEVFWTAFKALPKHAKEDFLARLVINRELREELVDLALIRERRSEKSRSFSAYLQERRARA